jgi:hypothetical protein
MQIAIKERHSQNAIGPISSSVDPGSNVTQESEEHLEKQDSQRISTDAGMQIDRSNVHS